MDIVIASLWLAMVLFILYETSAVYSYLSRLPFLNFITHAREYEAERKNNWSLSYSLFMQMNHGGFLIDLVTCRYCLGLWMALGSGFVCGFKHVATIFIMSQLLYSLFKATEKILSSVGEDSDG